MTTSDERLLREAFPLVREPLGQHAITSEYGDHLRAVLPAGWTLSREGIWVFATCPHEEGGGHRHVAQGFKAHVSATPACAVRTLSAVVPTCVRFGADFKVVGDPTLHAYQNSKRYPRGSSGKFMTIYPSDEATFVALMEALYEATHGLDLAGPRILSDRQYKDSSILHYRYGGIYPPRRLDPDGTQSTLLVAPSGEAVVDTRRPYFELPSWTRDPFDRPSTQVADGAAPVLEGRYRVDGAFRFSNSGGVYYGTDVATEEAIVIKEARPNVQAWRLGDVSGDAVSALEHEFEILKTLRDLDCVPSAREFFFAGGHAFLVQDRVEARSLRSYWARNDVIIAPWVRDAARVRSWVPRFRETAQELVRMVRLVHERGVLIGDLSSDNTLKNAETGQMWLVDFEQAVAAADSAEVMKYATLWATQGFLNPARLDRDHLLPEDDFYAAAMVLCNSLVPVAFFALKPHGEREFLDHFVRQGIPEQVREVILGLAAGDVAYAQRVLADWSS